MKRFLIFLTMIGLTLSFMYVADAIVHYILPVPSPHTVANKPVQYTAYQSYLAADGTVKLRRYIAQPTKHYANPFVGKKIVSITKNGASAEQNAAIARVIKECGSIDAVFLIEAESGWRLNIKGVTSDQGLWQWSSIYNQKVINNPQFHTWDFQIQTGCKKFRELADINEVKKSKIFGDWRTREGLYWHGFANAYNPTVLKRFTIITD